MKWIIKTVKITDSSEGRSIPSGDHACFLSGRMDMIDKRKRIKTCRQNWTPVSEKSFVMAGKDARPPE